MSEYLIINIAIICIPLLFSFENRVRFYNKFPYLLISVITVGAIFIFWDIIAVSRGDWSFNEDYIHNVRLFSLPLEEVLFFITVPYSCIFIYETVKSYIPEKKINIPPPLFLASAVLFMSSAFLLSEYYYTRTVLLFAASVFILGIFYNSFLNSVLYWLTISISFVPFILVNYVLTSLPIVMYSNAAILGNRFLTIPVEDFFYSFSMISLWLFIYLAAQNKLNWNFKLW